MWCKGSEEGQQWKKCLLNSEMSSNAGEWPSCKNPRRQGPASPRCKVKDRLGKHQQEQTVWIPGCNLAENVHKKDAEKAYAPLCGLCYMVCLRILCGETTRCQECIQHLLTNAEISFLMWIKQQGWWLCPLWPAEAARATGKLSNWFLKSVFLLH